MKRAADHVQPVDLLALAEGGAVPVSARIHLERCRPCRELRHEMEALVEAMRSDRMAAPGEEALRAAIAAFPDRPPLVVRLVESVGRLVRGAEDLRRAALAGVRGEAATPARLLFAGEEVSRPGDERRFIDLEVAGAEEDVRVTGQIFGWPAEELPALVWAERDELPVEAAAVGDHGFFVFERLPRGSFDLVLDVGGQRLRLAVPAEIA